MKLASSRDPSRAAFGSLDAIEYELVRLKAAIADLSASPTESREDLGQSLVARGGGSAFNFTPSACEDRKLASRRPSLPDPNLLEKIAQNRRKRESFFGDGLFADPAWDMILDLAIARARFRRVSVTSLCIASGVPSTTALRWISVMVARGIFQRENDDSDRRRAFISLTDAGSLKVARYFDAIEATKVSLS